MTTSPSSSLSVIPHLRPQGTATQLLVEGKPFIVIGGELHNSSASCLDYMERQVWDRVTALNCNTVLAPFYWELIEPEEGTFDFTLVDGLIAGARKRNMRLIPLWFGAWKNATSTYAPAWVKTDVVRFPRMQKAPGKNSNTLSSLSDEVCAADARAFAAVMKHLRETDAEAQTVIMMQVENETGLLGAARDYSPLAEKTFRGPVPRELMEALLARRVDGTLRPELLNAWNRAGAHKSGSWPEVFGTAADEAFMAWCIARYVNHVAAEGRKEYPIPCFVNCWLVQYPGQLSGAYPAGGPVSQIMDVWKIAAPEIALMAPDIYLPQFADVCSDYDYGHRNPLFIPEAQRSEEAAANVFYALGRHDAVGFAPFGIESVDDAQLAASYRLLRDLAPVISAHQGKGQMTAILQGANDWEVVTLGNYRLEVRYHTPRQAGKAPAAALIIAETPDQFIVAGHGGIDINFFSQSHELPNADYVSLEEGEYRHGVWHPGRRMNGDEYVVRLGARPSVFRAQLYRYA